MPHRLIVDERRARIVRFRFRDLECKFHFLVFVRHRVAQRGNFCCQEMRRLVGLCGERLAAGDHADAHEVRQRLAACREQLHVGRRDRQILGRDDRGIDHADGERLVAIGIAAHIGELHLARRDAALLQHRPDQQIGQRAGRRDRDVFAAQILNFAHRFAREQAVHQARPVAAEDLHVRAARCRHDRAARAAFIGIKLARE